MKSGQKEVRSKSKVVGTAEYPMYDSVAEAIEHEGEAETLKLINQQRCTNACNTIRRNATTGPSMEQLKIEVLTNLTTDELRSIQGDPVKAEAFMRRKIDEAKAKYAALAGVAVDEEEEATA
jgi:hypothetical protein